MRREDLYLSDIVESAAAIARFIQGVGPEAFIDDELVRSAVLQKLCVIGEAASRLSKELRDRHPAVRWPAIVAFRNIGVHAYFSVDWDIVWATVTRNVPELRQAVAEILRREYPDQGETQPDRESDN